MSKGKYQAKREPVVNAAICTALVLFWLVIITTYMSAGLFAKYATGDNSGDKARVIQFKGLTVTENDVANTGGTFIFAPGVPLEKDIVVNFDGSEADTFVFITVDVRGWDAFEKDIDGDDVVDGFYDFAMNYKAKGAESPKEIMSWSVDEAWTYLSSEAIRFEDPDDKSTENNGMRYVYYVRLDSNKKLSHSVIKDGQSVIKDGQRVIKDGQIAVSDQGYRADYKALANTKLNLDVTAYVVQANGFYTSNDMNTNAAAAWESLQDKEVAA